MEWLKIPAAFLLVFLGSFGTAYLASAWERRRKRNDSLDSLISRLPGINCGLCGHDDCRSYARRLAEEKEDPGLCAPGGMETEKALRVILGQEAEDDVVAFVRCGGGKEEARLLYAFDGRQDCRAAAACFQGSKACTSACLGFGSCVDVCPIGAIRIGSGLASVDHDLCTGCGKCVAFCPTGVIGLVPRTAVWQVACNSDKSAEEKKRDCSRACNACGDCERLSAAWEFSISGNLAKASVSVATEGPRAGRWKSISRACPNRAIVNTRGKGDDRATENAEGSKGQKSIDATS